MDDPLNYKDKLKEIRKRALADIPYILFLIPNDTEINKAQKLFFDRLESLTLEQLKEGVLLIGDIMNNTVKVFEKTDLSNAFIGGNQYDLRSRLTNMSVFELAFTLAQFNGKIMIREAAKEIAAEESINLKVIDEGKGQRAKGRRNT